MSSLSWLLARKLADPGAGARDLLGHAVHPVALAAATHHDQVARRAQRLRQTESPALACLPMGPQPSRWVLGSRRLKTVTTG